MRALHRTTSDLLSVIRVFVIVGMLGSALAVLTLGPRANERVPAGRVVVDYWEKWTQNEEQQMRQIVDAFNATVGRQKSIYVRYVSTSGIERKTLLATAAGVPPDVAGLWEYDIAQYAAQGTLLPLDQMAREHGIVEGIYKPVYWRQCHYDGRLYGLISTPAAVALLYNKRIFRENAAALRAAGLDPNRPPKTIAELDAYAKILERIGDGGRILRAGYLPSEPGWYLNYTFCWFGADIWDEQTHKFTLSDPRVVQAYTWIQSYSKRLGKNASSEFCSGLGNFGSPQNGFLTGTVVMEQQGPWMASFIETLNPRMSRVKWSKEEEMTKSQEERKENYEWGVAPFPSAVAGEENATCCLSDMLVIPRGARHPREAFEFIAYVNRQEVMEKLCMMHCKNSPLAKVSERFLRNHPNPYIDVFEQLAGSPNARSAPRIPIAMEVSDELSNMTQSLILLNASPAEALRRTQERLQARFDDFMRKQRARKRVAAR